MHVKEPAPVMDTLPSANHIGQLSRTVVNKQTVCFFPRVLDSRLGSEARYLDLSIHLGTAVSHYRAVPAF